MQLLIMIKFTAMKCFLFPDSSLKLQLKENN